MDYEISWQIMNLVEFSPLCVDDAILLTSTTSAENCMFFIIYILQCHKTGRGITRTCLGNELRDSDIWPRESLQPV